LFIIALGGCSSSEKDEKKLTVEDLGIVSKADGRKVYYGMKQADAEAVLGQGKERRKGEFEYGFGVYAFYRDGKVAALRLEEEAKDHYKTALNAEIGMHKDQFESIYGDVHMPTIPDSQLSYVFDMKKRVLLEENKPKNDKEAKNLLIFSALEYDGTVDTIVIIDSYSISHGINE
jgi:hypothetical protein